MREVVTESRVHDFMRAIAAEAREPGRVYIAGGASAVLNGWRDSTVDIDIKLVPEHDRIFSAIPALKERLHINVELSAPRFRSATSRVAGQKSIHPSGRQDFLPSF
jgi:hypothetical protein